MAKAKLIIALILIILSTFNTATSTTSTATSVTVEWNSELPSNYYFELNPITQSFQVIQDIAYTSGAKQITISDLKPNRQYKITLKTKTETGIETKYEKIITTSTTTVKKPLYTPKVEPQKNQTNPLTDSILAKPDPKKNVQIKQNALDAQNDPLKVNTQNELNGLQFQNKNIIFKESFETSLEEKELTLCNNCIQFSNDGKIGRSARIAPLEITTYTGAVPDGWTFRKGYTPGQPRSNEEIATEPNAPNTSPPTEITNEGIKIYGKDVILETIDQVIFRNNHATYEAEISAKGNMDATLSLDPTPAARVQPIKLNELNTNALTPQKSTYKGQFQPKSNSNIYKITYRLTSQTPSDAIISELILKMPSNNQRHSLKFTSKLQETGSMQFYVKPVFWQKETSTLLELPLSAGKYLKIQLNEKNELIIKTSSQTINTNEKLDYYEFTQIGITYNHNEAKIYINNELKAQTPISQVTGDIYLASNSDGSQKSKAYFDELITYSEQQEEFCLNCKEKIQAYKIKNQIIPPVTNQRIYLTADDNPTQNNLDKLNSLDITAFKGQRITTPFIIYSEIGINDATINPTALTNKQGQEIQPEVKIAYRWTQREKNAINPYDEQNRRNPIYQEKVPELLVKNDQITKYESIQDKAPQEPDTTYAQTKITAFKNKEIWIDAQIPENTKAGTYTSIIEIKNNKYSYELPLNVIVKDVTLKEDPDAAVGIFYKSVLNDPIQPKLPNGAVEFDKDRNNNLVTYPWINSRNVIQSELNDIKAHGFDSIELELQTRLEVLPGPPRTPHSSVEIINKLNTEILTMAKDAGLTKRIIYLCGAVDASKALLQTITHNVLGSNYQDAYCYGIDEPNTYAQIHAGNVRKLTTTQYGFKIASALPLRNVATCNPPYGNPADKINQHPEVDNQCPQYDMSFYGMGRDYAWEKNLEYYKQLAANPNDASQFTNEHGHTYPYEGQRGAGLYHAVGRENYARNQIYAGLFMWTTNLKVYWPYVYDHKSGNPYDDNDVYTPNTNRDQLVSYPTSGKPINTIQWEYTAKGITDNKILWNLENEPKTATAQCRQPAQAASEYAAQLRRKYAQLVILSKDLGSPIWDTPEQLQTNLRDLTADENHALDLLEALQQCENQHSSNYLAKTSKTQPDLLESIRQWLMQLIKN